MYQELGFEYLSTRRWFRKLCTFYKIVRNKSPGCPYKYILPGNCAYVTWNSNNIKQIFCRSQYFANSFFPYTITLQVPNSLWDKFSRWDPKNETLYEKKIQKLSWVFIILRKSCLAEKISNRTLHSTSKWVEYVSIIVFLVGRNNNESGEQINRIANNCLWNNHY